CASAGYSSWSTEYFEFW
nr:immunoglobulin heavy chain junction region [Macaca mulatta]MOY21358.1 immunoglobulin heavy chain junction region [Macaca mulatta]MOY21413.1 immunoglobulin heavy chain junction region [Macaca mulatta]MOY21448.1 immunoglobulin heavy chain junction region [Macaca mulatta]MOY21460.1 immunoglobulin heavy chain junction region [Macaca mulatta]